MLASHSGFDAAAKANGSHSRQCSRFQQAHHGAFQRRPRCCSPLCSVVNTHIKFCKSVLDRSRINLHRADQVRQEVGQINKIKWNRESSQFSKLNRLQTYRLLNQITSLETLNRQKKKPLNCVAYFSTLETQKRCQKFQK